MIQTLIDELIEKTPSEEVAQLKSIDFFTPDWSLWQEMPRAPLIDVIMISCGVSPKFRKIFQFDFDIDKTNGRVSFVSIASWELTRRLKITVASYKDVDFDGELSTIPIPNRTISTNAFYKWAKSKGWEMPDRFPRFAATVETNKVYPWGTHSTNLLLKLSEAAEKFWSRYDPTDQTTAPTNNQIVEWLTSEGVSQSLAESIATILRADGLKTGRR